MKPSDMSFILRPSAWYLKRPVSRDKADTLLLLAACVLVLAPQAGHLPWWTSTACAALLVWRGWITFRGNRMPPRWILVPMAVMAMVGVYLTHKTLFGREAGVTMLVLLLAFKLLEMRARRDLFVVVFMSFFLMLTNLFYSQTIGTALLMAAAVIMMLTAQLSFQYTGAAPPLTRRLAAGARIFLLAMPLALVLFILFPRIQGPLWGLPGDAQAGRSGLSDSMAPGNISNLALLGDIAFRVQFNDPPPPKSKLYWRGPVLGDYDGRTWTPLRSRTGFNRPLELRPRSAPVRYRVTLEPNGQRWLFALEMPLDVPRLTGNPTRFTPDLQIVARQPVSQRLRYEAASHIDFDLQPNEPPAVLNDWLKLPPGYNPGTLAFAAQLRSQSGTAIDRVNATLKFFREEKFSYTLEPPALGVHAVDDFLFSTRAGFCEHYASAFVVLMRALGIPARVVTGYQGGEINAVDGFMVVRQSDAHAWAEVWLEGRGWIRVDPTAAIAPDRIERNLTSVIPPTLLGGLVTLDGGNNSWLSRLRGMRHNWDAVTNAWNQWVLNYTPDRQRSFIQSLGFDHVDWRTLTVLMSGFGAAVMAVVALPLIRNRKNISALDKVYAALCAQMARQGCPRAVHEGPRAYRARLTAEQSPLAPGRKIAVARFLDLYEAIRYGALSASDNMGKTPSVHISKLKSLLAECR
jgi:transglutaminase-like putative cysteine protease